MTSEAETTNANVQLDEDSQKCGFQVCCAKRRTKIKCLECGNNAKIAVFVLGLGFFFQGFVVNGLTNVIFSTLERRFDLKSADSGFIASSYDIGFCVTSLLVAYVGGKGHKTQWIGWGVIIMAIGSFMFSLPHFIAPTYAVPNTTYACGETEGCEQSLKAYRGFFIAGQILQGIGCAPLLILAPVYFDENVKQRYSSTYQSALYAAVFVGAASGFLIGSALLQRFTNISEDVSISPSSVYWIGNWWGGFIVAAIFLFLLSLPILMYPAQLPDTERHRMKRECMKSDEQKREEVNKDLNYK